jgi:hypothetical protein
LNLPPPVRAAAGEQPVSKTVPKLFTAPPGEKVVENKGFKLGAARARSAPFLDRTVAARRI